MLELLVVIVNYLGTFAFALHGAQLVNWDKPHAVFKALIASFLCSFGGGLTRDLIILKCTPAILKSPGMLTVMLVTFMFYATLNYFHLDNIFETYYIKYILTIMDAAGVTVFIDAGVTTAFAHGATRGMIFLSGVITAIGGGIWGTLISGQHPLLILQSAIGYRSIIVAHTAICIAGYALPNQTHKYFIMALMVSCVVCCCIREYIILLKNNSKSTISFRCRKKAKINLSLTSAQIFWSIVNPMRGVNTNKMFFVYGGKYRLFQYIFSY